jgi:hypothetical protein
VFDNFFKKNTSKQKFYCKYAFDSIIFAQNELVFACAKNRENFILDNQYNSLSIDIKSLISKKNTIKEQFIENKINDFCKNCIHIEKKSSKKNENFIKYLYLSHWQCCFLNCIYCNDIKNDDLDKIKHYDITPIIEQLIDSKIITNETKIIFGCGDVSLHAEIDKLMYFFINRGFKDIELNISGQRYCQSIADAIGKDIAKIIISIDCGCAYIYEKIKKINKFNIAIGNTKRYLEFQSKNKKNIIYKYTIIQGINDNKKEILDWFMLSRNLGINKLCFDIDTNWFYNIKDNIPAHLEDIILFIKELSLINNFDIEFSKETNYLLNKIKEKK